MNRFLDEHHPLNQWKPRVLYSWKEWTDEWKKAELLEFRLSLLHHGFDLQNLSGEDWLSRIMFYLDVADGHNSSCLNFLDFSLNSSERSQYMTARGKTSRKAFQSLCLNFFKDKNSLPSWTQVVKNLPDLMNKILWFLRPEEGILKNIPETDDNYSRIAYAFATAFCKLIWESSFPPSWDRNPQLESARPQIIQILCTMGEADYFHKTANKYPMDIKSLFTLKQFVNDEVFVWRGETVKPSSLEEAMFYGSSAAKALHILISIKKEEKRLRRIAQAERERLVAERRLKKARCK